MGRLLLGFILAVLMCIGCKTNNTDDIQWRAELDLGSAILPFVFELYEDHAVIINAQERISTSKMRRSEDSLHLYMPVHLTEIHARFTDHCALSGVLVDKSRGTDYSIPFTAECGAVRFPGGGSEAEVVGNNWKVTFPGNDPDDKPGFALATFENKAGVLSGTMQTATGDYRFLEGVADEDSLFLSCFDGAHVFLFTAARKDDGSLQGRFYSGTHWEEPWSAVRDNSFSLPDPDSLTFVQKDSVGTLPALCFPDLQGVQRCLSDFDGPLLVQVMGSWCPNCRDETEFYKQVYPDLESKGIKLITLTFERGNTQTEWQQAAEKMAEDLAISWPVLLAGKASKAYASELFSNLNAISSFPTTIFVDAEGQILKIHTGFNGPATGQAYEKFKDDFHRTIAEMQP